jgi:hypothetical protein
MARRPKRRSRKPIIQAAELVYRAYRLLKRRPYLRQLARELVEALIEEDERPRRPRRTGHQR